MPTNREIFRKEALEYYRYGSTTPTYPIFFSSRRVFLGWMMLVFFVGLAVVAWSWDIPQYAQGIGIIQSLPGKGSTTSGHAMSTHGQEKKIIATIFFSSQFSKKVHKGMHLQIQARGVSQLVEGTIEHSDLTALTLEQARQYYHLNKQITSAIVSPVVVVFVSFTSLPQSWLSEGNYFDAYLQIDAFNLLSLF